MNNSTKQYFRDYNVRGLEPVATISREQYKDECRKILTDAINQTLADNGNPAKETDMYREIVRRCTIAVYRQIALQSTFFLFVIVLGNRWADNDYTYRLCLDVDKNKWIRRDIGERGHTLWVIAREHLKSTIITCASTLRELLVDPNRTFCIFSYNGDTAEAFLGTIKRWMSESVLLKEIFPDIIWENPERQYEDNPETGERIRWKWTQTEITVKRSINCKEASIAASGISGGAMTGYHYSHLIFDDAETKDMVLTSEFIDKCVDSITNTFNCGQTSNPNICFVGTFYAREDIYCRLIKREIIGRTVLQPCYEEDNSSVYYAPEWLEEKRKSMTPVVWATQMLCDPSMASNNSLSTDWLLRWTPKKSRAVNIYAFVDPAGTKTNKSDNTAILVAGFDAGGTLLVFDIIRDKLSLDEKFRALAYIKATYNPIAIFYERVGMQADIPYLRKCMDDRNFFFPIIETIPRGSKEHRIDGFIVEAKAGNIRIPYSCWHENWQGEQEDMLNTFIMDEFLAYPSAKHDDVLDVFAQAIDLKLNGMIELPDSMFSVEHEERKQLIVDDDPMMNIADYEIVS